MRRPWRLLCSCVLCACVWTSRNGQPRRRHRRWPSFTAGVRRSSLIFHLLFKRRRRERREKRAGGIRDIEDGEIESYAPTDSLLYNIFFRHITHHHDYPVSSHSPLPHLLRQFPCAFYPPFTFIRRPETNVSCDDEWRDCRQHFPHLSILEQIDLNPVP